MRCDRLQSAQRADGLEKFLKQDCHRLGTRVVVASEMTLGDIAGAPGFGSEDRCGFVGTLSSRGGGGFESYRQRIKGR